MILGFLADLHWKTRTREQQAEVLGNVLDEMIARDVDMVVFGGDLWDDPRIFDNAGMAMAQTMLGLFLDTISPRMLPWVAIPGNHDTPPRTERNALVPLMASPLFRLLDHDTAMEPYVIGSVAFLGLPWPSRDEAAGIFSPEALRKRIIPGKFNVLVGHVEVAGAMLNRYVPVPEHSTRAYSTEDLQSVGADLVLLGHLHARQILWQENGTTGLYVGALQQLNFGERDNPDGWLWIDTGTRKMELVPAGGPKYHVVRAEDYSVYAPGFGPQDRIRVIGERLPKEADERCDLQGVPQATTSEVRLSGQKLDPRMTPAELLQAWLGALKVEHDIVALLSELEGVEQTIPEASETVSALGSLTRVMRIRLKGLGPKKEIDIGLKDGRTAITGPNGSMKTTTVEAVLAGLYGRWASTRERGSLYDLMTADEASIEVEFEAGGATWKVQRELSRGSKGKYSQKAHLWKDGSRIVDGHAPQVKDLLRKVVGSEDMVLGTIFLSQFSAGSLVWMTPAERKDFMAEFLGLTRFRPYHAEVRRRLENLSRKRTILEGTIQEAESLQPQELLTTIDLVRLRESLVALREDQEGARKAHDALRLGLEIARESNRERTRLVDDIRRSEEAQKRTEVSVEQLLQETKTRQASLTEKPSLEAERIVVEASLEAITRRERIAQEMANLERQIAMERVQIAEDLGEIMARHEVEHYKIQGRSQAGCASTGFLPCVFLEGDPDLFEDLSRRKLELSGRHEDPLPEAREEIARLQAESETIPVEETPLYVLERRRGEIDRKLMAIESAEKEIPSLEERTRTWQTALREEVELWTSLQERLQALPDPVDLSGLEHHAQESYAALLKQETEIRRHELEEARLQERLEMLQERLQQAETLRVELAGLQAREGALRILERAFGRDGIPQFMLDRTVKEDLQGLVDLICREDFEGRYSLRLDTQVSNRDGSLQEAFAILFRGADGKEYDVISCSGGEQAAVNLVLSGALMLYQRSRSGTGYRVAFLDEPFAHQDAENRAATLRVVDRLTEGLGQICVSAHHPDMLGLFEHRIDL